MFHLLFGLSALAMSWVLHTLPFWIGGILQVLVTVFCRRWYFWVLPAVLSVVCMVWSVFSLFEAAGAVALAVYWGAYFLFLLVLFALVLFALVLAVKRTVLKWRATRNP
jgi:hypothetical protein